MRALVGAKRAARRRITSFDLENRVDLVRANREVLRGPAKDFGIEVLGGGLVRGGQFNPAKCPRRVLFNDGSNSGESLLPEKAGDKRGQRTGSQRRIETLNV